MRFVLVIVLSSSALLQGLCPAQTDVPVGEIAPFIEAWCGRCHHGEEPSGEVDLKGRELPAELLRLAVKRVESGEMPPRRVPNPDATARDDFLARARRLLAAAAPPADAGVVTLRRLSRVEYVNTVRDLLGVECRTAESFPADDLAYGFDNVGDALSISPLHAEKYLAAAEEVAERAINVEPDEAPVRRFEAELMTAPDKGVNQDAVHANLFSSRTLTTTVRFPREGDYLVRVRAWGDQAGPDVARVELSLGGVVILDAEVPEVRDAPGVREVSLRVSGGDHELAVRFPNDYYEPEGPENDRDRNLHVDWVDVEGPIDRLPTPWAHERIFALDDGKGDVKRRAARVLAPLARRTWRRPPRTTELKGLAGVVHEVVAEGGTFEEGVREALVAMMVSPRFLYRTEPRRRTSRGEEDLDPWSLASRLSYFLWSSMPDDRLLEAADDDGLDVVDGLVRQARRMLGDVRSSALATNFAAQWLELRNVEDFRPDPVRFAEYDPDLGRSMRRETELFFEEVLRRRLPLTTLLDADFTFVDDRLAAHYGLEAAAEEGFRRAPLGGSRRGGLLAHAAILAVTSSPVRTSPVKRGKWILENLLADPPGPPLPGVDSFEGEDAPRTAASLRERLAAHRRDPQCAVCHDRMDAYGLALENYDVLGRWRERDGDAVIDASAVLPDGTRIDGPAELARALVETGALERALLEKLFVYAVGRGIRAADAAALDATVAALPDAATIEDVILAVVRMDAFRRRSTGV